MVSDRCSSTASLIKLKWVQLTEKGPGRPIQKKDLEKVQRRSPDEALPSSESTKMGHTTAFGGPADWVSAWLSPRGGRAAWCAEDLLGPESTVAVSLRTPQLPWTQLRSLSSWAQLSRRWASRRKKTWSSGKRRGARPSASTARGRLLSRARQTCQVL